MDLKLYKKWSTISQVQTWVEVQMFAWTTIKGEEDDARFRIEFIKRQQKNQQNSTSTTRHENNTSTTRQENSTSTNRRSQKLKGKNWRFEPYFAGGRRKSNGQNPKKTSPTSLMRNAVWYPWRPYPRLLPKDELRTSNNQNDAQSSKGLISFNDSVIQEFLLMLQVQYYLFANSPKSKRILLGENKRC